MADWIESPEAIGAVDAVLAGVGLQHGRRSTRSGAWAGGERVRAPKASAVQAGPAARRVPGVVRVEGWEQYPWLRAGFSTRLGGASGVYSEDRFVDQNLGWTEADDPETVAGNRERFVKAVAGKGNVELVTARQFHSGLIRTVEPGQALATDEGKAVLRGDALLTAERGLMLGIQTADCVPVLLADKRTRAVGAFHAGWRGTLGRIVERGVGTMRLRYGSKPADLVAAIGPSIRSCCFAVGEEIRFDFESQFGYSRELFSEVYDSDPIREKYPLLFLTARAPGHSPIGPQIHLDLQEANRRQLLDAGLKQAAITVIAECTACARLTSGARKGERKYFSHRGESGFTGRMLSVIAAV